MNYLVQMVNTRRSNQGDENSPPLPPPLVEQLMMMQTQLLQQMAQNMQNDGNGNGNAHTLVFKHSTDPLQAYDWLHAIER